MARGVRHSAPIRSRVIYTQIWREVSDTPRQNFYAIVKIIDTSGIVPTIPLMRVVRIVVIDSVATNRRIPNAKYIAVVGCLAAEPATAHCCCKSGVSTVDRRERERDEVVFTLDESVGVIAHES